MAEIGRSGGLKHLPLPLFFDFVRVCVRRLIASRCTANLVTKRNPHEVGPDLSVDILRDEIILVYRHFPVEHYSCICRIHSPREMAAAPDKMRLHLFDTLASRRTLTFSFHHGELW